MVGHYPTIKLMRRGLIPSRQHASRGRLSLKRKALSLSGISSGFPLLSRALGEIIHALLTRAPLYSAPEGTFLARLACVKHAASVQSEPESNSPVGKY